MNTQVRGYNPLGFANFTTRPDFPDKIVCDLGVAVSFTFLPCLPPLPDHVIHVVLAGPQKETGRVDATFVVALVENEQAIGNRPDEQFVTGTVGRNCPPADVKRAVASQHAPGPEKAPVLLSAGFGKKPIDCGT
jgi:hypothetical protein